MKIIEGSEENLYTYYDIVVTKGWRFESNSNIWICYDKYNNPIVCDGNHLVEIYS